jgi:hypothetical protein
LLELLSRVEALEAANRPRAFTAKEVRPVVVPARPPETPLIAEVAKAIAAAPLLGRDLEQEEARNAVRAVAAWLRRGGGVPPDGNWSAVADVLDAVASR